MNVRLAGKIVASLLVLTFVQPHSSAAYSVTNVSVTVNEDSVNVLLSISENTAATIRVKAFSQSAYDVIAADSTGKVLPAYLEGNEIVVDALGAENVAISYSADDIVAGNNGIWRLSLDSDHDLQVILPASADILYINEIPLYADNNILFMPVGMIEIDYVLKSVMVQNFQALGNNVQVESASKIEDFAYADEMISFTVKSAVPVTVIVPKALLSGTVKVLLNGNSIMYSEYLQNSTHRWFMVELNDEGRLSLGSAEMSIGADARVVAKRVSDLILIRVTNDNDSISGIYGLSILIDGSVEAFKGPREWSRSGAEDLTESRTVSEPILPGNRVVFKLKALADDYLMGWSVYDQNGNILDRGEARPIN
jgi:hypothetical protein